MDEPPPVLIPVVVTSESLYFETVPVPTDAAEFAFPRLAHDDATPDRFTALMRMYPAGALRL